MNSISNGSQTQTVISPEALECLSKITKGATVKYEGGFYRVTSVRGLKVNLGQIFGSKIYYKGVSIGQVTEAYEEWYENWTKSEAYQFM